MLAQHCCSGYFGFPGYGDWWRNKLKLDLISCLNSSSLSPHFQQPRLRWLCLLVSIHLQPDSICSVRTVRPGSRRHLEPDIRIPSQKTKAQRPAETIREWIFRVWFMSYSSLSPAHTFIHSINIYYEHTIFFWAKRHWLGMLGVNTQSFQQNGRAVY